MNITKHIIVVLFIVLNLTAKAQDPFYQSYISGNMKSWEDSLMVYKTKFIKTNSLTDLGLIVTAQYGLIGYYIGNKQKEPAARELILAKKNIDQLIQNSPEKNKYNALKGALLGFEIALSPWKAMFIGPESKTLIEESLRFEPNSPFANFEYANMLFWAPSIVGGNKEVSLIYYLLTVQLLEYQKYTQNWYYLWVLTAYANALNSLERSTEAKAVYEKILNIEPNYLWVAKELSKTRKTLPDLNL